MKFRSNIFFSTAVHVTFIVLLLFLAGRDAASRVPERYIRVTLLDHQGEASASPAAGGKATSGIVASHVPRPRTSQPKTAHRKSLREAVVRDAPKDPGKTARKPAPLPSTKMKAAVPKAASSEISERTGGRKKETTTPVIEDGSLAAASGGFTADISAYLSGEPSGSADGTGISTPAGADSTSSGIGGGDGGAGPGGAGTRGGDYNAISAIRTAIEKARRYPLFARDRGIEGTVTAEFSINARGLPEGLRITKSSGFEILDSAAKETVIRAAPFPVVEGKIEIPIAFRLKRKE